MKKLLLVPVFLMALTGQAGTLKGNSEHCSLLANNMGQLAMYRDSGLTWEDAEAAMTQIIADAAGQEGSIITDAEDQAFALDMVRAVWSEHELGKVSPQDVVVSVVVNCMMGK